MLFHNKPDTLDSEEETAKAINDAEDVMIETIDADICRATSGDHSIVHFKLEANRVYTTGVHASTRLDIFRFDSKAI